MIYTIFGILGLIFGSFVNAFVWRIHEQDVERTKKPTEKRKKYIADLSVAKGRSMCPLCHHHLTYIDLVPVISWALLRGKCRYCHARIGWQYPIVELLTGFLFVGSYYYWPFHVNGVQIVFVSIWLAFIVGFMALTVYDLRWYILPDRIVYPLIAVAVIQVGLRVAYATPGESVHSVLLGSFWGLVIGGGIFYVLNIVSDGKWIGGGDVKLGALLGLILGGPLKSILIIFFASLLGSLLSVPLIASKRLSRTTKIPFGPFLIVAAIVVQLFGTSIIHYLRLHNFLPAS